MRRNHSTFAKKYGVPISCVLFALLRMIPAAPVPEGTHSPDERRQANYGHSLTLPVSIQLATLSGLSPNSPRRKLEMSEEPNKLRHDRSLEQILERTASIIAETKTEPDIIKNYMPDSPETGLRALQKSPIHKTARVLMPIGSQANVPRKTRTVKVSILNYALNCFK